MSLRQKLTKDEFDGLDEMLKAHYKDAGNGVFLLDFEGANDLSRAMNAEKLRADRAEARANEIAAQVTALQTQVDEAATTAANKDKDIPALNASWQVKLDAAIKKGKDAVENLQRQFRQLLVHSNAEAIAARISDSPKILLPHIENLLDVDFTGDMPRPVVLDATTRKPSALTLEELEKSFVDNADFASIVRGSGASGGGASSDANGGAGGGTRNSNGGGASKKISEMSDADRTAFAKRNPEAFRNQAKSEGFGRF